MPDTSLKRLTQDSLVVSVRKMGLLKRMNRLKETGSLSLSLRRLGLQLHDWDAEDGQGVAWQREFFETFLKPRSGQFWSLSPSNHLQTTERYRPEGPTDLTQTRAGEKNFIKAVFHGKIPFWQNQVFVQNLVDFDNPNVYTAILLPCSPSPENPSQLTLATCNSFIAV